jgi:hypothetical protein
VQVEISRKEIIMPRGVSPKREREYKKLTRKFTKEGRYKGRQKEVAARIVNKQRAKKGETKRATSRGAKSKKKR